MDQDHNKLVLLNSGGVAAHLHFDVNNAGTLTGGSMTETSTINPVFFWPTTFSSTLSSL